MNREEVMDRVLDSYDATVGGGSASAFAAAMAAGMIGMVSRLSVGKDLSGQDNDYLSAANTLDTLAQQLSQGAIDDTEAFKQISRAFKLPKSNAEEQKQRREAINQAAIGAALTPLKNAQLSQEVIKIAHWLNGKYNPNAATDFMIARRFLNVALYGFALNIEANLSLISDAETKQKLKQDVVDLLVAAGE